MLKRHRKNIIAVVAFLAISLACSLSEKTTVPENTAAPESTTTVEKTAVSGGNTARQPAVVTRNPKTDNLLNCAVIQHSPNNMDAWVNFNEEFYWFSNIIEQDAKGRMWLATDGYGLLMYDDQGWHNWQPGNRNDMSGGALRTMAVSETKVYVGAYGSASGGNLLVYDIENDQWQTTSPGKNAIRNNVIGGAAVKQTGQVYVMTMDGLDVLDNNTWIYFSNPLESDFLLHTVDDALFDKEGNYWLATNKGIWKFDGTTWASYTVEKQQLPSNSVKALDIDQDGRVWAATTSGLAVLSNEKWFTFSPSEYPWYQGFLENVAIDSQNRVWVTSLDVLSVYNGTEAILFTSDIIDESLWDKAIGFDKDGCVWVGRTFGFAVFQSELNIAPGNYDFLE